MNIKKRIINQLNKLPYIRGLYQHSLNSKFPNGHYYSPVASLEEIKKREEEIWKGSKTDGIKGIDLKEKEQRELVESFVKYYKDFSFKEEKQKEYRYYHNNGYYSYTDSVFLYSMIREFKPNRIIEVGSGFSSALTLDVNELFFKNEIDLTFIEPYPERLFSLMSEEDKKRTNVIQKGIQQVPVSVFEKLESGDILFVDSTHVSKVGSDVNYILFEILPVLQKGVLIHFHDIFYPFEYPKEWIYKGYNWNENYILQSFLMYNTSFEIKLFADYLFKHHRESLKKMQIAYETTGANLWIEKK